MDELEITAQEQLEEHNIEAGILTEYHCKRCGKAFFPTPAHVYKDGYGKYCSWKCFNHRKDGKTPRWTPVECLYPNGEHIRTFQSATKAAEWIGGKPDLIKKACMEDTTYKNYLWRYKV